MLLHQAHHLFLLVATRPGALGDYEAFKLKRPERGGVARREQGGQADQHSGLYAAAAANVGPSESNS